MGWSLRTQTYLSIYLYWTACLSLCPLGLACWPSYNLFRLAWLMGGTLQISYLSSPLAPSWVHICYIHLLSPWCWVQDLDIHPAASGCISRHPPWTPSGKSSAIYPALAVCHLLVVTHPKLLNRILLGIVCPMGHRGGMFTFLWPDNLFPLLFPLPSGYFIFLPLCSCFQYHTAIFCIHH